MATAEERGEQAEVDAVVAQAPSGARTLVAGYRYTGANPLFNDSTRGPDIVYGSTPGGTSSAVTFHRNSSIVGYSYSTSGGIAWSAPGKIYPPEAPTGPGDTMSIYWGDPGLASGDLNKSLVAYSFLGGSKALWDSKANASGDITHWPADDMIDSICVAISTDGGMTFPNHAICKIPTGVGALGSDQTSVAISQNRIYVTTLNLDTNSLLLYEVDPVSGFHEYTVPLQMQNADNVPRLRRDNEGRVWLAAATATGETKMCLVQPSSQQLPGSCFYAGSITTASCPTPVIGAGASIGPVRTGETFDFGAWHTNAFPLGGTTEFTFVYHTGCRTFGPLHVGATRCTWERGTSPALFFDSTNFHCTDITRWGTQGLSGQQFQPRVEVVDLGSSSDVATPSIRSMGA